MQNVDSVGPLNGVRVVDFTHVIAGPLCTQFLADAGATVIKIEPPQGEWSRINGALDTDDESHHVMPFFAAVNRSKESVVLDLRSEAGLSIAKKLIEASDVLVQNYSPGTLSRLGLDPERLRAEFPRLITVSVSLFGDSPIAQSLGRRGGITHVAEAQSGLMRNDNEPTAPEPKVRNVADPAAGIAGFGAVCAALYEREKTKRGRHVEVSMTATAAVFNACNVTVSQMSTTPNASHYAGMGFYKAADGYVALGANSDHLWKRLVEVMGLRELSTDPRFSTLRERNSRADEADTALQQWTIERTREEIVEVVSPTGVACGSVRTVQEVIADPQSRELSILFDVDDGCGGTIASSGNPWGFSQPRPRLPFCGESTADVLRNFLSLDDRDLEELAASGAFGGFVPARAVETLPTDSGNTAAR